MVRWKFKGSTINKKKFVAIKPKFNNTVISTLKDEKGSIVTKEMQIEQVCYNFYKMKFLDKYYCKVLDFLSTPKKIHKFNELYIC
jgi:hypothetical protein